MNPEILLLIFRVLMALVLYGFFGFALYLIWRSLPKPTTIDSLIPEIYALEYQGEVLIHGHRLKAVNLIGRAADNTIVLSDERVSAHHARITFTGGQWLLDDVGSRNGTFVNDHPIEGPLIVTLEDSILVGAATLQLAEEIPLGDVAFTT